MEEQVNWGSNKKRSILCTHYRIIILNNIEHRRENKSEEEEGEGVYTNRSKHNTGEHIVTTSKVVKWNKERMHCEIIFLLSLKLQDQNQILF